MPRYKVQGDDGKTYTVEGPEGATADELGEFIQTSGAQADAPAAPRKNENYGNEGYKKPSNFRRALGGGLNADVMAGVASSGAHMLNSAENLMRDMPVGKLLTNALKTQGVDADKRLTAPIEKAADAAYDEAGPAALAGRIGGDAVLTGGISKGATDATLAATQRLPKALRAILGGATGGAAGGAVVDPSATESRAGNALQGAGFGAALSGAGAGVASAGKYVSDLFPNAKKAAVRAVNAFEKNLGKSTVDSIDANLQNPRELPMTTAAAAESPGLAQMEMSARQQIKPRTRQRWENLDERTSVGAWEKYRDILEPRAGELHQRTVDFQEALKPIQGKLDAVRISQGDRQELVSKLGALRDSQPFLTDPKAQNAINQLSVSVMDDNLKLGALAHFESQLGNNRVYNDVQKDMLRDLVHDTVDTKSKGAWSAALDEFAGKGKLVDESKAANSMLNTFQDEGGTIRGRTQNEIPKMTSQRVRDSQHRTVQNRDTINATETLHPDDKERVVRLTRALQQSEYPRSVPAGERIDTGALADSVGNLPTSSMSGRAFRTVLRMATGRRDDATLKAMETALRTPRGWEAIQRVGRNEINASDAAFLSRILRAGTAAGVTTAATEGEK